MPREVRQPGTLTDNRDPGTGNKLILWANLILERLGWVDKSFFGGRKQPGQCWSCCPGQAGGSQGWEAAPWAEMKGAGYPPAKGQMSWDMKSSRKYLKNVNTKVEEELFSMLGAWN